MPNAVLWTPSAERAAASNLAAFLAWLRRRWGLEPGGYDALYRWSVEQPERFWSSIWEFCGVVGERGGAVLEGRGRMPGARWFPGARLNFAENLLRRRDDAPAVIAWGEGRARRELSFRELRALSARVGAALRACGVRPQDRVAALLPNVPEAVAGMLGAAGIGATWSSCSPDFGVSGVLDRFGQIGPKALLAVDGYRYGGKPYPILDKLAAVARGLPTVERVVVIPHLDPGLRDPGVARAVSWGDFLGAGTPGEPAFEPLPFDHPLYILYSSGTTGAPKCIVHGAGGTLLQHLKEHRLHCDVKPGDRVFYFTTCGWMMWNWLISALASEAAIVLYDGSPFHPDAGALWDMAEQEGVTFFGTSAKYLDAARKAGLAPARARRLDALRTVASTGSPLAAESFDYVYSEIKKDVCLSSISGGTDIVSCFVLGNPIGPVRRGEIQARGLGMKVEVLGGDGRPVVGEKGELVCSAPFPSMPVGFWNDPDGAKYRAAYFERYPGVWHHGDWAELTPEGGVIIYGRSDAVLKPGGVRIGTAEIYRQVEQLAEVEESLVVGQDWQGDVRVVLFVKLRPGLALDAALEERIRRRVRENATPRHVPARILQVADIPRTKSGKITELAVRELIHGRPVKNREALANPEALDLYRDLPQLKA